MDREAPIQAVRRAPSGLGAPVYCSTAFDLPTHAQLLHLLARARQRNSLEAVTGVLIYAQGSFVQYLEGPFPGLERVYRKIMRDPLHFGLIEIFREPIEVREFAEWSMEFAPTPKSGLCDKFPMSEAVVERLRVTERSVCGARHLLNACWDEGTGGAGAVCGTPR